MKVMEAYTQLRKRLGEAMSDAGEATAVARLLMNRYLGYSLTDIAVRGDFDVEPDLWLILDAATRRVEKGEPVQYVIGYEIFHGHRFTVTPDVLIPRPETERLVDMIADDYAEHKDVSILDIGTGSGCIAISLARALPWSDVSAIDISDGALRVAQINATNLKAKVRFEKCDILRHQPCGEHYDVIVSNPPYITDSERSDMEHRVLDYEPHTALFVDDSIPLVFYDAIIKYARRALNSGGRLYFETNTAFTEAVAQQMQKSGFHDVEALKDCFGRLRYAVGVKD